MKAWSFSIIGSGSGPQTTLSATWSSVTPWASCSKCFGFGSSWLAAPRTAAGGPLGAPRSRSGNDDLGQRVGQVVDPGVLDRVVAPMVALHPAFPQPADDLDRLLEHLRSDVVLGPAVAEDVLVEVLAGADAQEEATRHQRSDRRRSLGND